MLMLLLGMLCDSRGRGWNHCMAGGGVRGGLGGVGRGLRGAQSAGACSAVLLQLPNFPRKGPAITHILLMLQLC